MKTLFNYNQAAKIIGLLLAGLFLGWLFFGGSSANNPQTTDQHVQQTHTDGQGNIVYSCSMHPGVRQNEPGDCPICGMKLIPVSNAVNEQDNPYQLSMSQAAMKIAEVQTSTVIRDIAMNTRRLPGKIMVDERRLKSLPAHFPGRIETLYINFTGEYIEKGSKVASVYSPQLLSAQKELIEVAGHKDQNPALYKAARNKLKNWKIPESRINEIESSGKVLASFDINSHVEGYVMKRNISVGSHIEMGGIMYEIADLSKVWVIFDAYETDIAGLNKGDDVSFTVDAYPGRSFTAKITYINPVLNSKSRTISVRAEANNPRGLLKPNMLAEGIISSAMDNGREQILVPKSAVLWTGERSVVYVKIPDTEKPTFEFREVLLGRRAGDNYVIKSGLEPGEEVVTNGNFKIDSAAQLAGKASMMNRPKNSADSTMKINDNVEIQTKEMKIESEKKHNH